MTRKEALEGCKKHWTWMKKKADYPSRFLHKADFLEAKGIKLLNDCYCCEFVQPVYGRQDNCRNCPLTKLWPGDYGCEYSPKSPYRLWRLGIEPEKQCQKIIDACTEELEKLNPSQGSPSVRDSDKQPH